MLKAQLTEEEKAIFDQNVGLVEASIGRMVPATPEEIAKENPLVKEHRGFGFMQGLMPFIGWVCVHTIVQGASQSARWSLRSNSKAIVR